MWCGLLSEAGELDGIGRELLVPIDAINEKGLPIYRATFYEIPRPIMAGTVAFVGLYDAKSGGICLGSAPFVDANKDIPAGRTVTVDWPIGFGRGNWTPPPEPKPINGGGRARFGRLRKFMEKI